MNRSFTGLADLIFDKQPNFACFLSESKEREIYYRGPLGACLTQTCVRLSDLGATKHTPMVSHPLALLNPTIHTKFSCGKCEKLMVVQQLVPGTKTSSFTLRGYAAVSNSHSYQLFTTLHLHTTVCAFSVGFAVYPVC